MNTSFNPFAGVFDSVRPALRGAAHVCAVFGCALLERLDSIYDALDTRQQFYRSPKSVAADANGEAAITYEIPPGERIRLVSATGSGITPTGAEGCAAYLGSVDNTNLLHVFTYGERFSEIFSEGEYLDGGSQLIFHYTGQTPGERCTINLKYTREHEHPAQGVGGEKRPSGLPSNSVGTEIERHFPGILETEQPSGH